MDLATYLEGVSFRMKAKNKAFFLEAGEFGLLKGYLTTHLKNPHASEDSHKTARRILNHLDMIQSGFGLKSEFKEEVNVVIARFSQKMVKLMRQILQLKEVSVIDSRQDLWNEMADSNVSGQVTEYFTRLGQLGKLLSVLRKLDKKLKEHIE